MPRVLVISHNIFSKSGNMGKTMMEFLKCVSAEDLAQLYFHSEIPTVNCCYRYFRIKDADMLRSIGNRKGRYTVFSKDDIDTAAVKSRTDQGNIGKIYQMGRKRTPLIYFLRNTIWKLGVWDTPQLDEWIREFAPEMIFFACGDYTFAYRIVYELSLRYEIPVLPWCCDNYYIGRDEGSLLHHWNQKKLMKWVRKVMSRSKTILTISDRMARDYSELFGKSTEILRIPTQKQKSRKVTKERLGIVYAGNLGVNRSTPLVELAQCLKRAKIPGLEYVDVYSGEQNPKTLEKLTEENGIRFHGAVSPKEMASVLGNARYMLHVEAFDEHSKLRTGYSLSTKIGECLGSGACVVAYGPKDISSMEYLNQNQAAVFSENSVEIIETLKALEGNETLYQEYVRHAEQLVCDCHDKEKNDFIMKNLLIETSRPPHTF